MKNTMTTKIAALIFVCSTSLTSCISDSCGGLNAGRSANIVDVTAVAGQYKPMLTPGGYVTVTTPPALDEQIYAPKDIAITITGSAEFADLARRFDVSLSLFKQAHACSLAPQLLTSDVKSIRVFIYSTDNPNLQSGVEITDQIQVAASTKQGVNADELLSDWNESIRYGFTTHNPSTFVVANLTFRQPENVADGRYSYELMVTLDNGDLFTATTNMIYLSQP